VPETTAVGLPVRPLQIGGEEVDLTESGRHQQELGARQLQQRHLPGPATIGVGIEMELVHHHLTDIGGRALAQCQVRQDLRGGADDRRLRVHRGVTGHHADLVGAEHLAQREEFLADQGLDRRGVVGAQAAGQREHVCAYGDQGFAGPGRGGQDDVRPGRQLQ